MDENVDLIRKMPNLTFLHGVAVISIKVQFFPKYV